MSEKAIRIFSGSANRPLAEAIVNYLSGKLNNADIKHFSDGETIVEIKDNVRGCDVYWIQPVSPPTNINLMELLIAIDALKRASAVDITAVVPYYGYARQDRKVAPRTPITAKLIADLIEVAGATRVICMDLHAGQIQGFFRIPVDNIYALPVFLEYISSAFKDKQDLVVVSPDTGGVERARAYAKRLDAGIAIVDKRRPQANVAEVMHVVGDVKNKHTIIIDDIIDTAGTLLNVTKALLDKGALSVSACATHGLFSKDALDRIMASGIKEVIVTDTINFPRDLMKYPKVKVLSVASILGEAIKRVHNNDSVSSLFV